MNGNGEFTWADGRRYIVNLSILSLLIIYYQFIINLFSFIG